MKSVHRRPFVDQTRAASNKVSASAIRASQRSNQSDTGHSRRNTLLEGASLLAVPLLLGANSVQAKETAPGKSLITVNQLNSFQKRAEKEAFLAIVEEELKKALTPEDAPDTVRLVLHDAGTYDIQSGTGGINGSIVQDEELSRPENADLKPIVEKLKKVRSSIQQRFEKQGFALISWADLEVLAAKVANEKDWIKIKRANGVPSQGGGQGGGDIISSAFGASWPVKLGRVDSEQPDPAGRVPLNDASVKDLTAFFAKLGNRDYGATGFFAPKPYFDVRQAFVLYCSAQKDIQAAEQKLVSDPELGKQYDQYRYKYERSRATVTRTDYEVDFIEYFNQLATQGATFNPDKYYVPIEIDTPKL